MTEPNYRDLLLDEKDKEIDRLSTRVNQLVGIVDKQADHHILPVGRRVDDPPPNNGFGALKFRLALAARKHPVAIALTIALVFAAAFLAVVLGNQSHFKRDDHRLTALAHDGLRNTAIQAGQRFEAIKLLCGVNDAVVNIISTSFAQGKATDIFIREVELATGAKLRLPPLGAREKLTKKQIAPLLKADCPRQQQAAVDAFHRALGVYLFSIPPRQREAERRRLTPEGVQ